MSLPQRSYLEDYFDKPIEPPRIWTPERVEELKAEAKAEKGQTKLSRQGNKYEASIAMERAKQYVHEYARILEYAKAYATISKAQRKLNQNLEKIGTQHTNAMQEIQSINERARAQIGQYQQQAKTSLFSLLGF